MAKDQSPLTRLLLIHLALGTLLLLAGLPTAKAREPVLSMATTTSTQASGLLDHLLPEFTRETGIRVKVIAKGTGAAIRDGIDGNVDIIFVHARDREEQFVRKGFGTKRYGVMHNDFLIIGPESDPAHIKGETDAALALAGIARTGALFISRGDDSGTHTKEQTLWRASGVKLIDRHQTIVKKGRAKTITSTGPAHSRAWYLSIGQGMGKTATFADEKQAYTLIDRGTYIKYKYGKTPPLTLVVISQGDPALANPYGIIPINPAKHPHVRYKLAQQFAQWLTSPKGRKLINDYRLLDQQLFYAE